MTQNTKKKNAITVNSNVNKNKNNKETPSIVTTIGRIFLFPSSRKIKQRKFDRSHDHSKIKHAREKFKISMDPGKWDNHEGKIVIKTINIRDSDDFLC